MSILKILVKGKYYQKNDFYTIKMIYSHQQNIKLLLIFVNDFVNHFWPNYSRSINIPRIYMVIDCFFNLNFLIIPTNEKVMNYFLKTFQTDYELSYKFMRSVSGSLFVN